MEPEGLRRCLGDLKEKRVKIATLATDQHLMVTKMMREDFPKVRMCYCQSPKKEYTVLICVPSD